MEPIFLNRYFKKEYGEEFIQMIENEQWDKLLCRVKLNPAISSMSRVERFMHYVKVR
ncbi:hypothetical protein [Bacillus smithii]|uniref:hypothetical protein n=1 Tax=Bacillus smithii TaxID=1479 RepID=UPI002E1A3C1C|nr:hypothetical protein [Bacillus smithii]MED1457733.1 hypothetical protein [Bacillus smithii]